MTSQGCTLLVRIQILILISEVYLANNVTAALLTKYKGPQMEKVSTTRTQAVAQDILSNTTLSPSSDPTPPPATKTPAATSTS